MDYYCYNHNFGLSFCTPKCNDYSRCKNWHDLQISKIKNADTKLSKGIGATFPSKPTKYN